MKKLLRHNFLWPQQKWTPKKRAYYVDQVELTNSYFWSCLWSWINVMLQNFCDIKLFVEPPVDDLCCPVLAQKWCQMHFLNVACLDYFTCYSSKPSDKFTKSYDNCLVHGFVLTPTHHFKSMFLNFHNYVIHFKCITIILWWFRWLYITWNKELDRPMNCDWDVTCLWFSYFAHIFACVWPVISGCRKIRSEDETSYRTFAGMMNVQKSTSKWWLWPQLGTCHMMSVKTTGWHWNLRRVMTISSWPSSCPPPRET